MKAELHPDQAALSRALYVIRLRHPDGIIAGRWRRTTVASRRQEIARVWDREVKPKQEWYPKRWQPDHGRESPREDWMGWRRSMVRYAFPGWMRFNHGKGPPLVGRALLYCPHSERRSPF